MADPIKLPPLPEASHTTPVKFGCDGLWYRPDQMQAYAAAVTAAAKDCRTCSLFYDWEEGVCTQSNKDPCTNGDKYEPMPPVRLWRTT